MTEERAFEILNRIAMGLISLTGLKPALRVLIEQAVELTQAEYGGYFFNSKDRDGNDAWVLLALAGADEQDFMALGPPRITPLFSGTHQGAHIVRSDDVTTDPRYGALGGLPHGHLPLRSYLAVPVLRADGTVHGAMLFGHSAPAFFTPRVERLMANVATLAQVALDRSEHVLRLEHEVQERQRAEKRFSDLIEHSPRMKWWRSAEQGIEQTHFNRVWRDFTGQKNGPGNPWVALVHPDEREHVTTLRETSMAAGISYGAEFRLLGRDGRYRWLSALVSPVRDIDGRITGWVGTATDVTDRRVSEERFHIATHTAGIGVWEYDLITGRIIWTEEQARLYGIGLDEFDGTWEGFEHFVLHVDRAGVATRFTDAMQAHETGFEFRFRVRRADGAIRHIRAFGQVSYDADKRPYRVIGSNMDETVEVTARRAMLESERRLKATQDNAGVGICEIDRNGLYLRVNETFATMSDLSPEALRGMNVLDQIEDMEDRIETKGKFTALVRGEIETFECVRRYTNPGGRVWWADCRMTAVTDEHNRFLYAVRVVQDVTDARWAREQQSLLLAELTHRVKNTLAIIQSMASQTARTAPSVQAFEESFLGRLHAIAATHSLLIQTDWQGATFAEVLRLELAPYNAHDAGRCTLRGAEVRLNPSAAVNVGLVLHELITNAVKYGALTQGRGRLDVAWEIRSVVSEGEMVDHLCVAWTETGGPPVTKPSRKGFGARLFRSIAIQFSGLVEVDYEPTGVRARIEIPMTTIAWHDTQGPRAY